MKTDKIPELLAPAGSIEALRAAVNAGADAVYIGGQQFGARAYADNPSEREILEGIEYCHLRGKKLYLTVNTLLKENELRKQLAGFLMPLYKQGIDAVLVQDLGVLRLLEECFPELPLHASTQLSVTTPEGARFLMRHGVSRVVPARELTLSEIRAIVETGAEAETFVHGAMCYSYSGRCLFSSMLGGRSGNRGRCAQPCRLPYTVEYDHKSPADASHGNKDVDVSSAQYPLSMKDMCTLDILPELVDAGIASFKIEGRMKPPQYSAGVTAIYRKYIDLYADRGCEGYHVEAEDRRALLDLFDRGGFSEGYYEYSSGPHSLSDGKKGSSMVVMKRPNVQSAQSAQLKNEKNRSFLKENSKVKINGVLRIYPDTPVILKVWTIPDGPDRYTGNTVCAAVSGGIPEKARSNAATALEVESRIRKTGGTDFEFETLTVNLADGLFLPVSMLNELRRETLQKLKTEILSGTIRHNTSCIPENISRNSDREAQKTSAFVRPRISIFVTMRDQLNVILAYLTENAGQKLTGAVDTVYLDSHLLEDRGAISEACRSLAQAAGTLHSHRIKCIFAAPPVLRVSGRMLFTQPDVSAVLSQMDGFLVSSVDELEFFRELYPDQLFASEDCLYTFNTEAQSLLREEGITRFTLPDELNRKELEEVVFADSEMLLYGYQPLMQSAQCIRRNTSGCLYKKQERKKPAEREDKSDILYLRDRKNVCFPVLTRCRFCTNTVYNSVPLQLFTCREQLMRLKVPLFRLLFTVETKEETLRVLQQCETFLEYSGDLCRHTDNLKGTGQTNTEGTRGHFKRGVE